MGITVARTLRKSIIHVKEQISVIDEIKFRKTHTWVYLGEIFDRYAHVCVCLNFIFSITLNLLFSMLYSTSKGRSTSQNIVYINLHHYIMHMISQYSKAL